MCSISTLPGQHRYYLMKLIRQQYAKVLSPLSFTHYPSFNEWVEQFVVLEVMPNLGQSGIDVVCGQLKENQKKIENDTQAIKEKKKNEKR